MRDLVNEGRELQNIVTSKFAKMVKEAAEEEVSSPIRNLANKMEKLTDTIDFLENFLRLKTHQIFQSNKNLVVKLQFLYLNC